MADAYFAAISARDADAIRGLFAPDAELVSAAGVIRGAEQVARFYSDLAFQAEDLSPRPGKYLVDGGRLAVEIELLMNGTVTKVADVFSVAHGRIDRLAIYMGPNA